MTALEREYSSQKFSTDQPIIFHTDFGLQYTSNNMKNLCKKLNIRQSFRKKGFPYDNACAESFHTSLKKEKVYTDFKQVQFDIFAYIEG